MKVVDFSKSNTVVNRYIAELRDVDIQTDRMRFRKNIERIGQIMAYEVSRYLKYETIDVTTPFGIAEVSVPQDKIVAAAILRAALPLHQGILDVFDDADNAFVSAYRKYDEDYNMDIHIEYISSTSIENKTLILCDSMLATGSSMELAYEAMLTKGTPKNLFVCAVIASREALEYLQEHLPENTVLMVAAVDEMLDQHKYIVPGLGDAGNLAYGEKE